MSSKDAPTSVDSATMSKAEIEATVEGALDLEFTVLIGIFGKTEAPSAILRNPDGTILNGAGVPVPLTLPSQGKGRLVEIM